MLQFKSEVLQQTLPPLTGALPKRMESVDVYRGFVMFLMMAEVLSLSQVSESLPESGYWQFMAFHQSHVEWVGCSLHDLIQPSFSFLVGVALPFSIASRAAKGQHFSVLVRHALVRSLILILLGIFLRSMHRTQTYYTFEDTLTQIGLGYTFLFLLGFCSQRTQIVSLIGILGLYWLAFALYPLPGSNFNYAAVGIPANWEHNLTGFAAHWNKNTNLAWAFDTWFLNLFPREQTFTHNGGGYATLSFIPTLATMILGLLAGNILRSGRLPGKVVLRFVGIGTALLILAILLHITGICPIVKRIWTPAWTIFSGGWCFILLATFYGSIDVLRYQRWAFLLKVIGINSIAAYVMAETLPSFIDNSFKIHFSQVYSQVLGLAYAPIIRGTAILLIEWLILYWLYKKKVFVKI